NIEMIGRTNAAHKNAAFITGDEYSNLGNIFKNNLKGYPFKILRDPDPGRMLFERSDNFAFAQKGIPAHTIMSSNDLDWCYHKPCDEVTSIDIGHMTAVIKAIGAGMRSIVAGSDTPSRIDPRRLPDPVDPGAY
ncbi:MAG TPA: M28 family peptidase, partial [Flavisolibacter sp.]|nr:M28 family peptidase [Flavisolibacter sp.]